MILESIGRAIPSVSGVFFFYLDSSLSQLAVMCVSATIWLHLHKNGKQPHRNTLNTHYKYKQCNKQQDRRNNSLVSCSFQSVYVYARNSECEIAHIFIRNNENMLCIYFERQHKMRGCKEKFLDVVYTLPKFGIFGPGRLKTSSLNFGFSSFLGGYGV